MKILVQKRFKTLNTYDAIANNGTVLSRQKNKHEFRMFQGGAMYIVSGYLNHELVSINCADYKSAKKLFALMANVSE